MVDHTSTQPTFDAKMEAWRNPLGKRKQFWINLTPLGVEKSMHNAIAGCQ